METLSISTKSIFSFFKILAISSINFNCKLNFSLLLKDCSNKIPISTSLSLVSFAVAKEPNR